MVCNYGPAPWDARKDRKFMESSNLALFASKRPGLLQHIERLSSLLWKCNFISIFLDGVIIIFSALVTAGAAGAAAPVDLWQWVHASVNFWQPGHAPIDFQTILKWRYCQWPLDLERFQGMECFCCQFSSVGACTRQFSNPCTRQLRTLTKALIFARLFLSIKWWVQCLAGCFRYWANLHSPTLD